jgi:hypothetical protein
VRKMEKRSLTVAARIAAWSRARIAATNRAATVRSRERMRPQAGVGGLKPAPPLQAHELLLVGHALACPVAIFSHLLTERSPGVSKRFLAQTLAALA